MSDTLAASVSASGAPAMSIIHPEAAVGSADQDMADAPAASALAASVKKLSINSKTTVGKDGKDGKDVKQNFEIKKINLVALWAWDIVVDNCAICRNHIMDPCIECQANPATSMSEECTVSWGTCNHAFHHHCINRWLKQKNACPLCQKDWGFLKIGY